MRTRPKRIFFQAGEPFPFPCVQQSERPLKGALAMKKMLALLTVLTLLVPAALADETPPSFADATGLNDFLSQVTEDNPICSAWFTEDRGFSDDGYETNDPEETQALLDAVLQLEIVSVSDLRVTDWYPRLQFICTDGTAWGIGFEGHWLNLEGVQYNLAHDEAFWALTSGIARDRRIGE